MRAALALGTHGTVAVLGQVRDSAGRWTKAQGKAERYRASTRYRDRDGNTYQLERFAPTKGEARRKLNAAIADFETETELRASVRTRTMLATVARTWLAQVERSRDLSDNTKAIYRDTWHRCIEGTELARTPLAEANTVPVLRAFLQDVADERGSGTAKTARSVLSGIIGLAMDDGLVSVNACRSIRPVKARADRATPRDTRRALTKSEREHLLAVADSHERAQAQDVADIIAYMAGTGVRISEALAQRWRDVDLDAGTVHVRGTKSGASDRVLPLPKSLTKRLRERAKLGTVGLVFPSPGLSDRTKVRDRRNVARIFRQVMDEAGLPWATPHSLRRTAATLILEAGQPVTVAQAQLGHADASMTLRVYAAKRAEPSKAAARALE